MRWFLSYSCVWLVFLDGAVSFVTQNTAPRLRLRRHQPVQKWVVLSAAPNTIIEITANNLEMTPTIRAHVEKKLRSTLKRYEALIHRCETHLTVNRNPRIPESHCCEVVLFLHNHVVRAEERTSDMYASIDLVSHKLARKLRKLKERRERKTNKPKNSLKRSLQDEQDEEELDAILRADDDVAFFDEDAAFLGGSDDASALDAYDEDIVRRKTFAISPQTLDDAKASMADVDHDFYVFTNADTDKVNVLYKRKHGGLGLIEADTQ